MYYGPHSSYGLWAVFILHYSTYFAHSYSLVIISLLAMRAPLGVRIFSYPNNFTMPNTVALP